MNAIVFDTETTDIKNPEIIEAAWMYAYFAEGDNPDIIELQFDYPTVKRFKPKGRISMGAMATHHIMDEDLADCPPASEFKLPDGVVYMIGHNVDFDWKMAGCPPDIKRIDTLCLARNFWPECDAYTLGALTYHLYRSTARADLQNAHSAEADVLLTGNLLKAIIGKFNFQVLNFEQLWERSESARVPDIMPYGKHKGMLISEIPRSYKEWLSSQQDVDPYLLNRLLIFSPLEPA